jgi:AhpD family alkylhydroperoxidase
VVGIATYRAPTMHEASYPALTQAINQQLAPFRKSQAATMQGFGAMAKGAMAAGALTEKEKELIALGIGVSQRCAGCIGFHVKALRRLETTRAELEEALAVAVYMGGGPSLMYAAEALQAWDQFAPPA